MFQKSQKNGYVSGVCIIAFLIAMVMGLTSIEANAGIVIEDDFNDDILSPSLWNVRQQDPLSVVEQGGILKITAPVGDKKSGGVNLIPVISGDFDVKVDYNFLSGTSSSSYDRTRVHLKVRSIETGTSVYTHIWRSGAPADGAVMLSQDGTPVANIWSPPKSGALRLKRVSDIVKAYYYRNGWQYIGSITDFSDPVTIGMSANLEGGMSLDLELDNFSVAADVPEPATLSLLAIGSLALLRKRK